MAAHGERVFATSAIPCEPVAAFCTHSSMGFLAALPAGFLQMTFATADGAIFGTATKNMSAAEYVTGIVESRADSRDTSAVPYIFHSVRCQFSIFDRHSHLILRCVFFNRSHQHRINWSRGSICSRHSCREPTKRASWCVDTALISTYKIMMHQMQSFPL